MFGIVAFMCVWKAIENGGAAWILCWPGWSFAAVAAAYAGVGPSVFGKQPSGALATLNVILLLPYLLYTWGVWHLWRLSSREPAFHELGRGITIGRRLLPSELPSHVTTVFDLTSEFPEPHHIRSTTSYRCLPTLDGKAPDIRALRAAALEIIAGGGSVYIHCANGRGRTGTLAAAVLMLSHKAETPAEAIAVIRARRPSVALNSVQVAALWDLAGLDEEASGRLESSWSILAGASDRPVARFVFSGVHEPAHGRRMSAYMETALADAAAAGVVIDVLDYELRSKRIKDLAALFMIGFDRDSRSVRPVCIIAVGKTSLLLRGMLEAMKGSGLDISFASDGDEARRTLAQALAAHPERESPSGGTPPVRSPRVPLIATRSGDVFGPMTFGIILAASAVALLFDTSSLLAWIPMAIVAGVGGYVIAMNWGILLRRRTGENDPLIPFMGGVLTAIALARCPAHAARAWWWLPLVIDPTCLPTLLGYLSNGLLTLMNRRGTKE